jgi:hypothetical protein
MAMTAVQPDVRLLDWSDLGARPPLAALGAPGGASRESRLAALCERAERRKVGGALSSALSSGLLSGDPDQTEALYRLASDLGSESDGAARRRALSSLLTLGRFGEPGALSLLAWLGDERRGEALADVIAQPGRPGALRAAAVRGALHVLRVPGAAGTTAGALLLDALRSASEDGVPALRYTAAWVRAALGQREARGCLERGALEEGDPGLLRLCLLGLEAVGDGASLPFVWRVWMRQPGLRDLADAVSERLEEDLRRRQVNLLEGTVGRPEVESGPAPADFEAPLLEVVVR